ncbi:MAG TPA: LuxR C-terminal-related transcriptional regulator [Gemmatimonadales bacterium]|nr:LuxR C-terminal-related transcriptional regulator [Gemmatimonadales bacterium]
MGSTVADHNPLSEVMVPKQSSSEIFYPPSWEPDRTDRLLALFSTFSALNEDSRVLVRELRSSIQHMRELKEQIRSRSVAALANSSAAIRATNGDNRYGLTRRERQVAELLARGKSNAAIARQLGISSHTARHHTQRVLAKLEVHSRAEAGAKLRNHQP